MSEKTGADVLVGDVCDAMIDHGYMRDARLEAAMAIILAPFAELMEAAQTIRIGYENNLPIIRGIARLNDAIDLCRSPAKDK